MAYATANGQIREASMTVMSREQVAFMHELVKLAGDPVIVENAMREVTGSGMRSATFEDLIRKIVELRDTRIGPQPEGAHVSVGAVPE